MRATVFAATFTLLLVSPGSAQMDAAPPEQFLDRLSVEVFGGYVPAATDWMWVDMDWSFTNHTSRHRLEQIDDGAPLAGIGVRYDVVPGIRITGALAYARRDDRSINLHSSSRVNFTVDEQSHLHWGTAGGGTTLGRIGLDISPLRTQVLDIWLGGGAGLVRETSGSADEVPSQFDEFPPQFVSTRTAPTAFLTGRVEAPLTGSLGLSLAADHHWVWWDRADFEDGVEEFFEAADVGSTGVTADGIRGNRWLLRLGVTYHLD